MAFLQELLLEDKSLLIACGGKKGGGRRRGVLKSNTWFRGGTERGSVVADRVYTGGGVG